MSAAALQTRHVVLAAFGLALLVGISFLPLRHGEYVQDDEMAVERNLIVERGALEEIFTTSYWEGGRGADRTLFRPIVIGSYALERSFTGEPDAPVSRAINIALHVLVSFALMLLARRIGFGMGATLAGGALFALHPVHVEAVANVVGRAELLAALFSLAALYALSHSGAWDGREPRHPRLAAWAAGLLLFLALGSKEIAVATPFLMASLVALFAPRGSWRDRAWLIDRAAALAPAALACVVYLALRVHALEMLFTLQKVHPLDNVLVDLHGTERLATALGLVARYAALLFYPIHLANDYSGSVIAVEPGLLRPLPIIGALLLAVCVSPVVLRAFRLDKDRDALAATSQEAHRAAAFSALLCLLPYAVIGNIFFIVGAAMAERFLYMPSTGFCLLCGLGLAFMARLMRAPLGSRVLVSIVGILMAAFSLQVFARSLEWQDNRTIFEAAARVNPESPRAHFVLGKLSLETGDPDGAIRHLDRVLALRPDHPTAWLEKGNALAAQGRFGEAERFFRETLRLAPTYATAHRNLALALRRQRRFAEAEKALQKAALWRPDSPTTWAETGNLYLQLGRYDEAATAYRRAISLGRSDLAERLALAERGTVP